MLFSILHYIVMILFHQAPYHIQNTNMAVLSGICPLPTLQVTVIGSVPLISPPVPIWILNASRGSFITSVSTLSSSTSCSTPLCSYFRLRILPVMIFPSSLDLACISQGCSKRYASPFSFVNSAVESNALFPIENGLSPFFRRVIR